MKKSFSLFIVGKCVSWHGIGARSREHNCLTKKLSLCRLFFRRRTSVKRARNTAKRCRFKTCHPSCLSSLTLHSYANLHFDVIENKKVLLMSFFVITKVQRNEPRTRGTASLSMMQLSAVRAIRAQRKITLNMKACCAVQN